MAKILVALLLAIGFISNVDLALVHKPEHHHHIGKPLDMLDLERALKIDPATVPSPKYNMFSSKADPQEKAGLFEGDIMLTPEQATAIEMARRNAEDEDGEPRNAIMRDSEKWPGGIVPYIISSQFTQYERAIIALAFTDYLNNTCVAFHPRRNEIDYIHIQKGNGCSSQVGRSGGAQPVILGTGCVFPGIVAHELMHAIGFWHEQSRWDRDEHVVVYFGNIQQGMEFNFQKLNWREIRNLSAPYDTSSILHYGSFAFSKGRNLPTILPRNTNDRLGQRDALSKIDIYKINKLYNCPARLPPVTTPATPATPTSSPSKVPSVPSTIQPQPDNKCTDTTLDCIPWSEQGECSKNPAWMLANCRKSCKKCDGGPTICKDHNKYCSDWQGTGECEKNAAYMHIYCAKSCGKCSNDDSNDSDVSSTNNPSETTRETQITTTPPQPAEIIDKIANADDLENFV